MRPRLRRRFRALGMAPWRPRIVTGRHGRGDLLLSKRTEEKENWASPSVRGDLRKGVARHHVSSELPALCGKFDQRVYHRKHREYLLEALDDVGGLL
jgi:hypothetical protein